MSTRLMIMVIQNLLLVSIVRLFQGSMWYFKRFRVWLMLELTLRCRGVGRAGYVWFQRSGVPDTMCPVINKGPAWSDAPRRPCSPVPAHPSVDIQRQETSIVFITKTSCWVVLSPFLALLSFCVQLRGRRQ